MRVPDAVTHLPVFLAVKDGGRDRMAGTAFFISVPSETRPGKSAHGYLVTARHCVEKAKKYGTLYVRINRRAVQEVPTSFSLEEFVKQATDAEMIPLEPPAKWYYHEDETNDVAVLPMAPPVREFQFLVADERSFATDELVQREAIGVGDDLLVVGLFTSHHGRTINRPIVRSGIIAAMPEEPLEDSTSGLPYDAYLAEIRSVGGLSGSPVWLVINPARVARKEGDEPGKFTREHRLWFYLLGLIRGHWKKEEDWLSDFADDNIEALNTGIAIVTPIQKALEIVAQDELVKMRKAVDEEADKKQEGREALDVAEPPENDYDRFEALARRGAESGD